MRGVWVGVILTFVWLDNARSFQFESTLDHVRTKTSADIQQAAVENLIKRTLPGRYSNFSVVIDPHISNNGKDVFKLEKVGEVVKITGTTGVAAASAFNHYLKYFCQCHISWEVSQLNLPDVLPEVNLTITFNDRFRYYQNVCTSSYSFAWWDWAQWEKHIDWIVLNSFNFVLAFTGQEAIWQRVYQKLNLTDADISEHFAGPAFLAWLRMGNLRGWGGPLSQAWHERSIQLQHNILDRMRSFGIITILPAFAGHVPRSFKNLFPNTNMTLMSKWNNFADVYCCPYFIDPTEDLFQTVGKMFLEEQISAFGTDNVYNCDSFNEMEPQSTDLEYLANVGKSIYSAMKQVDPNATWVMQGWLFVHSFFFWTPNRAKALLTSIPKGSMIVLDLQSEQFPQYDRLDQYYGQPFIWCMLHNFGGTLGMHGSSSIINKRVIETRNANGSTMIGTGLTMEGINQNYVMYDLMTEFAWRDEPVNLSQWFRNYSIRRYGKEDVNAEAAWEILRGSVYDFSGSERLRGHFAITRSPDLNIETWSWYKYTDLFEAWNSLLTAADNLKDSPGYLHDLVDVTRQVLQANGDIYYDKLIDTFNAKNTTDFQKAATIFREIFKDLESILATNEAFLIGKWIESAKKCANNTIEEKLYEYNARNQITLWGPFGEILDYAVKQWSGMVQDYLYPRWDSFIEFMNTSLAYEIPFNQKLTKTLIFLLYEEPFCFSNKVYPTEATGDTIEIARQIHKKYWYTNSSHALIDIKALPAKPKKTRSKSKKPCEACQQKPHLGLRRTVSKMKDLNNLHTYLIY
ncbi:N-acetyl-alpha-glucosaminidase isoform X2 [Rhynchophorus ferrugineus]|uniref:N-acetyl-alpha-glucosaminidase isoform X2 n=1 Tax=Rhynchophorus ferrugineus TaxID=354439 RepID=UPI003FCECB13